MDGMASDAVGTASTGKKAAKKKILPTVGPIGWTPELNKTKPKKAGRASLPVLPSSVAPPSPPSAQPPKKKRKKADTPQEKPSEPVWPSLDSFANLTPQEILARFSNPSSKLAPKPKPKAGKHTKSDKLEAPQPTPDPSLSFPSSSGQTSAPTIEHPQPENLGNQVQSSETLPPKKKRKSAVKLLESDPAQSTNVQPKARASKKSITDSNLNSHHSTNEPTQKDTVVSHDIPFTGSECVPSHPEPPSQSQPLHSVEKDAPTVEEAPRKKRRISSKRPAADSVNHNDTVLQPASMAPSTQSNVSATLDVQPSKTNNSQAKASTTTSMPLTGQNPLQATGSQAEKNSTTASRPAHQAAPSHATEPVLAQDKNNDGASDNPTRNADGDAEQHSFSIPHKLSLQSLKKEKTKAKAKHKKLLKKQGLRSGSVSTTHTTQEPRCFSSVSASPHHKETEYHVLSRQSTPASMLNVPKHFGRWELSIPSDREIPVALLARMHQFLDEAVCAGFAKPIFRDPTPAITTSATSNTTSPQKDVVLPANPPNDSTKMPISQQPTSVRDENNPAKPAHMTKSSSPLKTTQLADRPLSPVMPSAPNGLVSAAKPRKHHPEQPTVQPPTPVPDENNSTNLGRTKLSLSSAPNTLAHGAPVMTPHDRAIKRTLSTCSSSLSEDINNTVMMTLGLDENFQYDFETNSNNQQNFKGPAAAYNKKSIEPPRHQLEKEVVSASTSEVNTASSSNPSDEASSNKVSAPSLPPPDHHSSTPPTSNHSNTARVSPETGKVNSKTEKGSQSSSLSENESDSSSEDESDSSGAPPSAQRPRKSASSESSSSGDESSSTTGSHVSSPEKPPPSQLPPIPPSQNGIARLYGNGPVTSRRKTLDAFRPIDFISNPSPVITQSDPKQQASHSEKESSSDDDDSESDSSSGSEDGRAKKQAADRPLGLPAHKLAGSAASAKPPQPSPADPSHPTQSPKKRTKPRRSMVKVWEAEVAKIEKAKKKC
ncbi:hypothetical protein PCASD_06981 [Puccinia coronata f. sp. avenae]|uniref:Uncharacterized protein n=1 Tax=Puccinia coronata f. sp. avenae TaxID=200324 RepID=A0A2N5UZY4_9BASI|nr:hypothetical protein PCASD_06981 [Puccinia coronata f. sp. avenae]